MMHEAPLAAQAVQGGRGGGGVVQEDVLSGRSPQEAGPRATRPVELSAEVSPVRSEWPSGRADWLMVTWPPS